MAGFHLPMAGWFCLPTDNNLPLISEGGTGVG
jgi:hypothetical protein